MAWWPSMPSNTAKRSTTPNRPPASGSTTAERPPHSGPPAVTSARREGSMRAIVIWWGHSMHNKR
ncbi:Uncharacterised protein [Mycobacteroides abscessus subsp. abscessus]|nr:Uncharacterised protein [Mycobacteroides abscessus subsp. abscessus]